MSSVSLKKKYYVDKKSRRLEAQKEAQHLFETGLDADCQFLVGADNDDGSDKELIKAHQKVLAERSPVFRAMFFGKMAESADDDGDQNVPIPLPDLTPSSFKDLLKYIYTADSMDLESVDQAIDLYYAAQKYILPKLVDKCIKYIMENLSPENVFRVLDFTQICDDKNLKEKCVSFLRKRTQEIVAHSDFVHLPKSTLSMIMKEEALYISEFELFLGIERWAVNQCAQKDIEINGINMREILGEIIDEIRFLSMTSEQFSSSPVLSGILTEEESFAIFMNKNNRGNWPFPLQLSPCRRQRRWTKSSSSIHRPDEHIDYGIHCFRQVKNENVFHQEPFIESITTLTVDQDVKIKGFVIAEMILPDEESSNAREHFVLDFHLKDSIGNQLISLSAKIPQTDDDSLIFEPLFKYPYRLTRNKTYQICVSVNQRTRFLLGKASPVLSCQGVNFNFSAVDSSQDGFVCGVFCVREKADRKK